MDEHTATIERLTRERDAAQKRVVLLERAIRDPYGAASTITPLMFARYLEATGWVRRVPPFWTKANRQPISVEGPDLIPILRQIDAALPIVVADLLEYADAPR